MSTVYAGRRMVRRRCTQLVVWLIVFTSWRRCVVCRTVRRLLHVASRVVDHRIHQLAPVCRVQDGQTALHVASRVGDVGTVQLVISRGADVDAATADGYTALHIAAKEGHDDVAHALLELGASTTPTTKARRHAVLVASGRIASDTIRYDTRCYFNVRSKADISQLNLPHGT